MTYLQPLFSLIMLAVLAAAIRQWRARAASKPRFLVAAVIGMFLLASRPVARLASQPFERSYIASLTPADQAQAIVVLASAVYPRIPPVNSPRPSDETYERTLYAAWLYQNWRAVPILSSGGTNHSDLPPYSRIMLEVLRKEGIPEADLWLEDQSHSTHQAAVNTARILRQKGLRRIALVTSAYHMFRAESSFRKMGLEVVPAACGFRSTEEFQPGNLLLGWEPVSWHEDLLHEIVGMLWYRLRGWA
jgi:uncharacterized SAM-binding protein YcdF (DUF218 family)